MKIILIALCMVVLMGCNSKQEVGDISIYKALDAKQTYQKLINKMNSEVDYVKFNRESRDASYSDDLYNIDHSIVTVRKVQFKEKASVEYSIWEKNNQYILSDSDEDGIYSLQIMNDKLGNLPVLLDIFNGKNIDIKDIKRKDSDGKIELELTFIQDIDDSKSYISNSLIIGEDGFLESLTYKYYISDTFDGIVVFDEEIKAFDYNQQKTIDIDEEVKLITSLNGASKTKVEEKIFK